MTRWHPAIRVTGDGWPQIRKFNLCDSVRIHKAGQCVRPSPLTRLDSAHKKLQIKHGLSSNLADFSSRSTGCIENFWMGFDSNQNFSSRMVHRTGYNSSCANISSYSSFRKRFKHLTSHIALCFECHLAIQFQRVRITFLANAGQAFLCFPTGLQLTWRVVGLARGGSVTGTWYREWPQAFCVNPTLTHTHTYTYSSLSACLPACPSIYIHFRAFAVFRCRTLLA